MEDILFYFVSLVGGLISGAVYQKRKCDRKEEEQRRAWYTTLYRSGPLVVPLDRRQRSSRNVRS